MSSATRGKVAIRGALITGLVMLLFPLWSVKSRYFLAPVSAALPPSVERAEAVKQSARLAKESLGTLKAIWQSEHNNEQILNSEWSLGDPLPVTVLGYDELRRSGRVEENPENVFGRGPREIIYPVSAEHSYVGAVTLRRDSSGDWRVSSYGGEGLPDRLFRLRQKETDGKQNKGTEYWAVSVTPLDYFFLACKNGNELRLIAIANNPSLRLEAGQSISAEVLYPRLVRALTESSPWRAD